LSLDFGGVAAALKLRVAAKKRVVPLAISAQNQPVYRFVILLTTVRTLKHVSKTCANATTNIAAFHRIARPDGIAWRAAALPKLLLVNSVAPMRRVVRGTASKVYAAMRCAMTIVWLAPILKPAN